MKQSRRNSKDYYALHNADTEPTLPIYTITAPIPAYALPRESWIKKLSRRIRHFFSSVIHMTRQFLALALAGVLLLLLARFALTFFAFSLGIFSSWVFFLSKPLVDPFVVLLGPLLSSLPYGYYTIDISTLVAIVIYTVGVAIVRWLLKPFEGRRY